MEETIYKFDRRRRVGREVKIADPIERIENHLWFDDFWRRLMAMIRNKRLHWSINYRLADFLKKYFRIMRKDLMEMDFIDGFLRRPSSFIVPISFSKCFEPKFYLIQTKSLVKRGELSKEEAIYFIKLIFLFWKIRII